MSAVLEIIPGNPDQRHLDQAVELLRNGGVISYPTDTIYGLGASIMSKSAIERIYHIKKTANNKLLSFICKDLKDLSQYAYVSNSAYRIMRRCLPGPFTFILPTTSKTPKRLYQKRRTVGIRVPDSRLCYDLVDQLGMPIVSTSVPSGPDDFMSDPHEINRCIGDQLDLIFDGGILISKPSTIVDLTGAEPVIVRHGEGDISLIY